MNDNRFKDLEDLKSSIEMGLDIEFSLYGDPYYIGAPQGKLMIVLCPDIEEAIYANAEELLNNHKIKGKALKDIWQDIEISSM